MRFNLFTGIILILFTTTLFAGSDEKEKNKTLDNKYRRGIVVYPSDIVSVGTLKLVEYMRNAELNLLAVHTNTLSENLSALKAFLESKEGKLLLEECEKNNISVEFESHVLQEILPRELFSKHPEYFRMDKDGSRKNDHNMCFSSEEAYKVIEKNIIEISKWLKPTTHRYLFWTDDVEGGFCNCDLCKKYSESEQALMYENRLLTILRKIDPKATLAHLAYHSTLKAPSQIKPSDGIFLEYAPISRDYATALPEEHLRDLKENLKVFPANTTHILEYWLDASMFSKWNRNSIVKVPWKMEYCERDVKLYRSLGITSVTCFATWMINGAYIKKYGEDTTRQVISEYGSVLKKYITDRGNL